MDCSFNNLSANYVFFATDWPKRGTVPQWAVIWLQIKPGHKMTKYMAFIWHSFRRYEAKHKKYGFWHWNLMQTLLIWLILVESAIKNGISSNDQDVWQKTHLCWNLQCDSLLHYPSCSITCWKYTFLQYTNFVASSSCNYLELQLTNFNWVEPLSLAQLCPSLFSNLHVRTGILRF